MLVFVVVCCGVCVKILGWVCACVCMYVFVYACISLA